MKIKIPLSLKRISHTFLMLFLSLSLFSQITVDVRNKPIKEILREIENNSSFKFFYNNNLKGLDRVVTLKATNENIDTALRQLFAGSEIDYQKQENDIILLIEKKVGNSSQINRKNIRGTVKDEKGETIIGASVKVKGESLGTVTDINGEFSLDVPQNATLVISYIGYTNKELTVGNETSLDITIEEDNKVLSEVVVVGYGIQKKVNLTGSIASINNEELSMKPTGQLSSTLQGLASGVTITTNSGQPGLDKGTIRIRGIGTLNDNDPLVLIDGVEGNIDDVDSNDIQTISVLKDAAASSIYGVRAANGVILITTKRGNVGKTKINYSNYFGWQKETRMPKIVGAQDFMSLANLVASNSDKGNYYYYSQQDIDAYNNPNRDLNKYADNNWTKDILQGSGFQQMHSISLQGGSDYIRYAFSTNYFDQSGLIKGMDYDRLTMRLNTDIRISPKLDLNIDLSTRFSNRKEPQGREGSAWQQFATAYSTNPTYVNKYTDGTWAIVRGEDNIIRLQDEGGRNKYESKLYTGSLKANYELIEGLKLSGMATFRNSNDYNGYHQKALSYYTDFPENTKTRTIGTNNIKKESLRYTYQNYQGLVNYNKTISNHSFSVMSGVSYLNERNEVLSGYRTGIPNGSLTEIDAGNQNGQVTRGTANEYGLFSIFGRANYSYEDKYLFEANIRRDGSSRFKKGQRWGVFPSFSAGWRISEEVFMKDVDFVDNLKIRASWGQLGNDKIGNYPYQTIYVLGSYPFGGSLYQTSGMQTYPNDDLTWETTSMTDIGFDFTTLSNKLNFTFDYYIKNTKDILMRLEIPATVGLSAPYQNAGEVENKGWELSMNYNDKIGEDFRYSVGFNLSDVKNKVIDIKGTDKLSSNNYGIVRGLIEGKPINSFYGYRVLGIYQTEEQLSTYPGISGNVGLGDLIYRKNSESASFGYDDMEYLGSNIPRYTYGINLGAEYKGFDFSAFLQGVGKASVHTMTIEKAPTNTDGNFRKEHLNSWTPTNTGASFPRLVASNQNYQSSSYWVKSGSYLRLKNIQVGYTLPKELLSKLFISKLRVYMSGNNLLTFTGLPDDIDPESPNDMRYYPQVKTYTFGLNIEF